jgi:hypothetical protein
MPRIKAGFLFSPAFAEAASRRQAGMTKRDDDGIYRQIIMPMPGGRLKPWQFTVSSLSLAGEGGGEGGISWVSPSPQSSPPVGGEEVFEVVF